MDPLSNTSTSVTAGSCTSTLLSGMQHCMPSLEACASWLLGGYLIPTCGYLNSIWRTLPPALFYISLVREFFTFTCQAYFTPTYVGTYIPSAQSSRDVPVVSGYPTHDQAFPRALFQPLSGDFFNTLIFFSIVQHAK